MVRQARYPSNALNFPYCLRLNIDLALFLAAKQFTTNAIEVPFINRLINDPGGRQSITVLNTNVITTALMATLYK